MLIAVDTFYAEVAAAAVSVGAHVINDVSGGTLDPDMHDMVTCLASLSLYFLQSAAALHQMTDRPILKTEMVALWVCYRIAACFRRCPCCSFVTIYVHVEKLVSINPLGCSALFIVSVLLASYVDLVFLQVVGKNVIRLF